MHKFRKRSFYIIICLVFFFSNTAFGDVVILKNGGRIQANKTWSKNGQIVCSIHGSTISFDKNLVLKVEKSKQIDKGSKGGFNFDIWQSGMDIKEILAIAKTNDIPLHKEGIISINKKFNPLVSTKYYKTATRYYYKTKLLGKYAKINLFLTPTSKRLYKLSINWSGPLNKDKSEFQTEIVQTVSKKYGHSSKVKRQIFKKIIKWIPSNRLKIELQCISGSLILIYKDLSIYTISRIELKIIKNQKRVKYQSIDSNKF